MGKRICAGVLAVCLALLLGGCGSVSFQNVNELLRAPAMGQGLDEIQKALKAYLGGEEPQYKYPKGGDERSPIIRADLNGDGREEAVLLYSVSEASTQHSDKGSSVYVAVMEQLDGDWKVIQDVRGLATEVASLEVADLLGDGSLQVIIGYAAPNLTSKVFALYRYMDFTLEKTLQYNYSRYEIGDFTGRGRQELVVVSREEEPGRLQLYYVPVREGQFATEEMEPVTLDTNFMTCVGISPSAGPDGTRLLVVDGNTSTDTGALTSQLVYYEPKRDVFRADEANALRGSAARPSPLLVSRDIDGDGIVEIPQQRTNLPGIQTSGSSHALEFVDWMDFTGAEPLLKQFGLMDTTRRLYVSFPEAWRSEILIEDGAQGSGWVVKARSSRQTLLTLLVLQRGEDPPVGAVRVPGSTTDYLVYGSRITEAEREQIIRLELTT